MFPHQEPGGRGPPSKHLVKLEINRFLQTRFALFPDSPSAQIHPENTNFLRGLWEGWLGVFTGG